MSADVNFLLGQMSDPLEQGSFGKPKPLEILFNFMCSLLEPRFTVIGNAIHLSSSPDRSANPVSIGAMFPQIWQDGVSPQNSTTARIDFPACINSKPSLI